MKAEVFMPSHRGTHRKRGKVTVIITTGGVAAATSIAGAVGHALGAELKAHNHTVHQAASTSFNASATPHAEPSPSLPPATMVLQAHRGGQGDPSPSASARSSSTFGEPPPSASAPPPQPPPPEFNPGLEVWSSYENTGQESSFLVKGTSFSPYTSYDLTVASELPIEVKTDGEGTFSATISINGLSCGYPEEPVHFVVTPTDSDNVLLNKPVDVIGLLNGVLECLNIPIHLGS